ncbi:MAG: EF-P 5-aminopentanol modification-associated protein YfmH [Dethiobacteria bacterium]|jgi:predicted Zn-dependent peptidase
MHLQVKNNASLQEKIFHAALEGGPDLYILPRQGYNKKYAIFSTRFGSIDNAFRFIDNEKEEEIVLPDGVAHFLEHKLFDEEDGNVFDRFAYYGASPNAFTSFTHTTYLFSCTDFFPENFKLLLDFVQAPYFTEESVAKEQGIIQQEIRMYQDNPNWRVYFGLLEALYARHPVRNDIAGTAESISKITKDLLYKCYYTFYHPRNMAIFVTGDLVPEEVCGLVEENLAGRSFPPFHATQRLYPREEAAVYQKKVTRELSVSQPLLNMGFKDTYTDLKGRELFARELTSELLLEMIFGKGGPFFTALYEEGLIDEHFDFGFTGERSYGYTLLGGRTKHPEKLHARLLGAIKKIKKDGLGTDSFARYKRKMRGQLLRSFNSLEFIANNYLAYRFRQIDFFEILDLLEEIKIGDLEKRLHEHLREELHAVSVVYPVRQD